jgi:hypothetical protein
MLQKKDASCILRTDRIGSQASKHRTLVTKNLALPVFQIRSGVDVMHIATWIDGLDSRVTVLLALQGNTPDHRVAQTFLS